jgi:hypothetical protein
MDGKGKGPGAREPSRLWHYALLGGHRGHESRARSVTVTVTRDQLELQVRVKMTHLDLK